MPELLPLLKNEQLNIDIFRQDYLEKIAASVKNVSRSQMRRIFDELKKYKISIEKGAQYSEIYPYILMEKAKLSYLCKRMMEKDRNNAPYYANLKSLIFRLIDMCNSASSYIALATFFEAMFGYYFEVSKPEGRQ
ncbi:MAG TPA: type III-A CRISPR-associated protein Csm2 [Rectinema sp.]|nr:type III-A CRISPR-associated protein Csm2 [Rectinema sp.]